MSLYICTPFVLCKVYIHISSFIWIFHSPDSTLSSLYLETITLCILSLLMKEGNSPKGHTLSTSQLSWNSRPSMLASPLYMAFPQALMKLPSLDPIQWCPGNNLPPEVNYKLYSQALAAYHTTFRIFHTKLSAQGETYWPSLIRSVRVPCVYICVWGHQSQ